MIRYAQGLTAILAGEGYGCHPYLLGRAQPLDNIGGFPARSYAPGDIPLASEGLNLSGEDAGKICVVADAGQNGGSRGQGDGRQRRPIEEEVIDELGGDMLGIGGTAAVAEDENFIAVAKRFSYELNDLHDGIHILLKKTLLYLQAFLCQLQYCFLHRVLLFPSPAGVPLSPWLRHYDEGSEGRHDAALPEELSVLTT